MRTDVADELPGERRLQTVGERVADREPTQHHAEQVQRTHGEPEVRERADEHQHRRKRGVDRAAPPPRGQDAQQVTHDGGNHQCGSAQQECPADLGRDDLGDRGGETGDGNTHLPGEDVVQVVDVLLPNGSIVNTQQLAQGLDLFGLHSVLGAGEHAGDGVAGHETREQEIQGDGCPEGDQVETQAAQDEAHGFPPFGNCGKFGGTPGGVGR